MLAPAWEPELQDQEEYVALARGLAAHAAFTAAAEGETIRPELRRVPGYPLLLAPICRISGCDHWHVALVQALLHAALVPLAYALATRMAPRAWALAAAAAVAAYPTFAYFAALTLSDLPATTVLGVALVLAVVARERRSPAHALASGAALGFAALTRSVLATVALPIAVFLATARPLGLRLAAALALGVGLVTGPFAVHSVVQLGALPSSAGEGLWYGYFQGRALLPDPDPGVCAAYASASVPRDLPPVPGLDALESELVHRGQCRRSAELNAFVRTGSPGTWMRLEQAMRADAMTLIAHDPAGWIARGITFRTVALWARDEPLPMRTARATALEVRSALVVVELLLLGLALIGLTAAARRGSVGALALACVMLVWAASIPFWTEARYVLPVRPLFLIGVVLGAREVVLDARRRRARARPPAVAGA